MTFRLIASPWRMVALAGSLALASASNIALARPSTTDERPTAPAAGAAKPERSIDPSKILERVAFIGASATAGFGAVALDPDGKEPLVPLPLAASFSGAIAQSTEVHDFGSGFFFMTPPATGRNQVTRALAIEPTLVVAVDFLFWFGYGADDGNGGWIDDENERLAKLELGLRELERIPSHVPVVIGDFPDMSRAVGKMLSKAQMPKPETLAKLNDRVKAWLADRPNVVQFSLGDLVERLKSNEPVDIGGLRFERSAGRLIQTDDLHPTSRGSLALGLRIAEVLRERFGDALPIEFTKTEADAARAARERAKDLLLRRMKPASDVKPAPPVSGAAAR
jgi:hypothetical protein